MHTLSVRSCVLVLWSLTACTGSIGDPGALGPTGGPGRSDGTPGSTQPGGGSASPGMTSSALQCTGRPADPGPAPLRLLSRAQYLNTVRDLFGDVGQLESVIGSDNSASELGLVQGDATQVQVEQYQTAASSIASAVVTSADKLKAVAPCTGTDKRACASELVKRFGARAYRAPIDDAADIERHLALYDVGAKTSFAHGIELLLQGMLQSPRFLYRVELGTSERVSDQAVKLSGYEVAARLSYSLWNTLPDQTLTSAAADGKLASVDGVAAQLDAMLQDERGKKVVRRFLESWLHLGRLDALVKDEVSYPDWKNPSLRASLRGQAQSFLDYVLEKEDGTLSTLLTSPTVFVNKDLASYYGVSGGDSFAPIEVKGQPSAGVLTLPALLSINAKPGESSPIYRGKFVRESLFCQQLPAPPPDIPKAPEVTADVSARERLRQHEVDPSCSGCHSLMDPIGFGLESFDAIGRFRKEDGGKLVDTSGEIQGSEDSNGKFNGAVELGQMLADSEQVHDCIARQWFRFALSRFEQSADDCSMQSLLDAFNQSGQDLNTLPRAVVLTDAFLYRRPIQKETP